MPRRWTRRSWWRHRRCRPTLAANRSDAPRRSRATSLARKRRHRMRNGFKVYDVDTHVMPIAEVLERYVDPSFRPRLAELTPYRVTVCIDASTVAFSARRVCTPPSPAEVVPGAAPSFPVPGCRMIGPTTGSRTWTTRARTSTFSSRHHGRERWGWTTPRSKWD